jgi:hypothetical protein
LKLHHLILKPPSFIADPVSNRDTHILEMNLGGVGGTRAKLIQLSRNRDPFDVFSALLERHANQRLVAVHRSLGRISQHAHPVRLGAIGNPHFRSVDDVVIAVTNGFSPDRGDIRPRLVLGNSDTSDAVAADRRGEEFASQSIGTEPRKRRRRHVGLHPDRHADAEAIDIAERLVQDCAV